MAKNKPAVVNHNGQSKVPYMIRCEKGKFTVVNFYRFSKLSNLVELRQELLQKCNRLKIKGTILLAEEGINSTIAGPDEGIKQVLEYLNQFFPQKLDGRYSQTDFMPFYRLKVKIKSEIVTMGVPSVDPRKSTGIHLEAQAWNDLISDPETILIDTRNDYEVRVGTFKGAINPNIQHFRTWPKYVEENLGSLKGKKIAMYCTGGIRCEKASSYMLEQGFSEVYQLNGGIINYLAQVKPEESLWQGECFVFDQRVALTPELSKSKYDMCFGCRDPITEEDKLSPFYEEGVSCSYCYDKTTEQQKASCRERQKQAKLAKKQMWPVNSYQVVKSTR